jgi:transposase
MRGAFVDQGRLFSYISPEARVPANHPLRNIRELVRDVLGELNRSLAKLYASEGRPSIPPEQLLSALLLQVFYGIRSERQLMEQLDYNLLYRWFVGLSPDDPVWDPSVFTKNRDRLQNGEVFAKFMSKLLNHPQVRPLLSDEHFSVDGTLIEAWASQKSFRPKDGSGDADGGANFHGQQRKNDTHASTTDPDSRLYRKAAGRRSFATWATPPWRTGMGWRWLAWSRSPTEQPSAVLRRRCSRSKPSRPAGASRWVRTRPMTRPIT